MEIKDVLEEKIKKVVTEIKRLQQENNLLQAEKSLRDEESRKIRKVLREHDKYREKIELVSKKVNDLLKKCEKLNI